MELEGREKTADVRLWLSFLPQMCYNKADEGKCQPCIIPDEPAWMNNYYCDLGQGKEGIEIYNPLTLKPFHIGSPASRHVIKRGCWGGYDMPRSFGNKKIFLVAKHSGKWNDSPQRLSTSSKRWDGNMGFICKEEAGVRLGGLAGCVEWAAVMSGRKHSFRNASLSPLCLIIWMASPCVTQRRLYRGCRGY